MAAAEGKPTLQHLNNSQSQHILWLLEELEIPYNLNLFERVKSGPSKNRAPESLKETHPLGKSPQLITASGRVIIERSAISAYLINTYDAAGKFKVSGADEKHDVIAEEQLISFANASIGMTIMIATIFYFLRVMSPFFIRPLVSAVSGMVSIGFLNKELNAQLNYLDNQLEGQEYFLSNGNPTRVDVVMLFFIQTLDGTKVGDISKYPNVKAWHDRCVARPAWKRAMEKGNGYEMSFT
ncbi:glutathione S-transferase [Xylariaceae sp. FL1272]|nr:glutathione S-transferase [Xylariaceae sp. FL1272]